MGLRSIRKQHAAFLSGILLFGTVAGCRPEQAAVYPPLPGKINELGNTVDCIDEMPDWTGKQFDLITWYCHGTWAPDRGKTAKTDLFREELKRVSGITVNEEKSFDNNGESGDVKISKLIAKDEFPDIAFDLDLNLQARLIKADKIYDLTDLIPKYATNLMKIVNASEQSRAAYEDLKADDKLYFFPKCTESAYQYIDPDFSREKYQSVLGPAESRGWIWVRDDILTALYPQCKTQAQILDQYITQGTFSPAELQDFKITGLADFRRFLEQINSLNLQEDGRKIWPFYTHNGTDNWSLLSELSCLVGAYNISYFSYYDMEQQKILPTMKQPWFKELLRFYNELVRDGLAAPEAITDDRAEFERKKNNGEYAIIYGLEEPPTDQALRAAGKNFSYRKVLIDVPMDARRFGQAQEPSSVYDGLRITIFKSERIQEQDLEQIIRFLDFFYSDAGMKYSYYGPKKSGLYTETEDGILVYTDPKMEADMIDSGSQEALADYGFAVWPSLEHFATRANIYDPRLMYARLPQRRATLYTMAWNSSVIAKQPEMPVVKLRWNIWSWAQYVEGVQKFWDARQASETAIQMIFTARDDQEFDLLYQDMVDIVESNGLTEETMEEWNMKFNEMNKDYIYNIQNWNPEIE